MNLNSFSNYERTSLHDVYQPQSNPLERADRMIDKFIAEDNSLPQLVDRLQISCESGPTISGMREIDYPNPLDSTWFFPINQFKLVNKIPLPPEILEQCGNIGSGFTMGMFPEINRAWLTIESDIYLWNFETGGDVAYFDGLNEPIVSVGLVAPKPGIFQKVINHLLIITTPMEIIVLGVMLSTPSDKCGDELQLTPEIIYSLPTDGVPISVVKGTKNGRIFMGGRDGDLYELVYRREMSWGGKRAWKVNHSRSMLSYLIPSFVAVAFSEEDRVADIAVDNSRNILFILTERGSIQLFYLGQDGNDICSVATLTHYTISKFATDMNSRERYYSRRFMQRLFNNWNLPRTNNICACLWCEEERRKLRMTTRNHKNLSATDISRVVALCPLEECDSPHFGLVAVTKTGVRFYVTTGSPPPHRPTTLSILHLRLPPGYSPTSPPLRPGLVTLALHKSGTMVVVTGSSDMVPDRVWCFTMDGISAFRNHLTEAVFVNNIAPAVAIGESQSNVNLTESGLQGHVLVYQQNYSQDRFIILTQQGTEVYEKLRPVDIMAELLREKNGPDCEEMKTFFIQQGADQACAMALILACDHASTNVQMCEWATRAFFLYGGDPMYVLQTVQQPPVSPAQPSSSLLHQTILHHTLPPSFLPGTVSTPLGAERGCTAPPAPPPSRSVETYGISMSSKHNGLYLFLSRLLRPIWHKKLLSTEQGPDKKLVFVSSISSVDLCSKTVQLYDLRNFLAKNTPASESSQAFQGSDLVLSPSNQRTRLQEAKIQEKESLDALRIFVSHATQVLSLWKILCEHQLHVIVETLTRDQQNLIQMLTFREFVLKGNDLCHSLITKLIALYLKDNASVDGISSKLREVCPVLYKSEDATCSKVNEILRLARDENDEDHKLVLLRQALKLCKEVSPNVDVESVCKSMIACGYYDGVLELCQDVANKADPAGLASKYLGKDQASEDLEGSKAFLARHEAYKEIIRLLDYLYQQCQVGLNGSPPVFGAQQEHSSQAVKMLERMLEKCLSVEDESCHLVVYEWLVSRDLQSSLVVLGRPSLERFLLRYPIDSSLRDLLWQYHEKSGNHPAAAQVLYKLATTPGDSISLNQRLTYLGKAVMCMRSDVVGCAPHLGVFLHELEDLVQVARIQKQVHDRIATLSSIDSRAEAACRKLNQTLLSITELYERFAEPFELWECKLAILDCAGHDDKELINSIWDHLITREYERCNSGTPDEQVHVVMSKVRSLGLQFTVQSPCFPIEYLVWQLELFCCKMCVNKSHVHSTMSSLGVPVLTLLDIYSKMYTAGDKSWLKEGNELHLIEVIANFAESFTDNPRLVSSQLERKSIAVQMQDLITSCLSVLYSKSNCSELVSYLKGIQTKLSRI